MLSDTNKFSLHVYKIIYCRQKEKTRYHSQTEKNPKAFRYLFYTMYNFAQQAMYLVTKVKEK